MWLKKKNSCNRKWFVVKDKWQQQSIFKLLYFKVGHCVSKCVLDVFIMDFYSNIVVLWEPLVNWQYYCKLSVNKW